MRTVPAEYCVVHSMPIHEFRVPAELYRQEVRKLTTKVKRFQT
jgi:hypothetical protein